MGMEEPNGIKYRPVGENTTFMPVYPTDLTHAQWEAVKDCFHPCRPRKYELSRLMRD